MLFVHWMRLAASRADWTAGSRSAISTAMIAITTSSSMRVKPVLEFVDIWHPFHVVTDHEERKPRRAENCRAQLFGRIFRKPAHCVCGFPRGTRAGDQTLACLSYRETVIRDDETWNMADDMRANLPNKSGSYANIISSGLS